MYLSYSAYQTMGGQLPEAKFNQLEYRAEKMIDRYTHGRITNESPVREAVKNLVFELVGVIEVGDDIASVSNDGYSVSYGSNKERRAAFGNIIKDYLSEEEIDGICILYAGVD